jgi:hypothetical protein
MCGSQNGAKRLSRSPEGQEVMLWDVDVVVAPGQHRLSVTLISLDSERGAVSLMLCILGSVPPFRHLHLLG